MVESFVPYLSSCQCGDVQFKAQAEPAFNVVCYCKDCQDAGQVIAPNTGSETLLEADGGTAYSAVLDKDWVCVSGKDKLREHKLKPDSLTSRFVATCCDSPMYLKYSKGYWTSTFRNRYTTVLPALKWRVKVSDRESSLPYPDDIARFKGFPLRLYWGLMKAKWKR